MNLDNLLSEIFITAYSHAKSEKHEYFTPEHILFAALHFEEAKNIIINCGGDVNKLKEDLQGFFKEHIPVIDEADPIQTLGVQNIVSNAGTHVLSSEKETIKFSDVLVSIYNAEDTFASYFLRKQGIKKLDILKCISHNTDLMRNTLEEESALGSEDDEEDIYEASNRHDILKTYSIELTEKAKKGQIDPIIGRDDILRRTLQVLCRRLKNNPIHVGESGVGKTAITEGLAKLIAEDKVPSILKGSKIYSLDIAGLLAGTKYRGDFEERIKRLLKKIKEQGKAIVYIDEIHTIIGTGAVSGGSMDAANILKPFLTDGKLRVIGSTTYEEYKKHFEKDSALSRRFQKIEVFEPSKEDTYNILLGLKSTYENYHKVTYSQEALRSAVELSEKYIHERHLPDKAIDVVDEAGAFARLSSEEEESILITEKEIEKIIASMAKIPEKNVSLSEINRLKTLDNELKKFIFGQEGAIETVVGAIKRSRAGFNDEQKPIASLLFVGQTGVGKTEIAKKLGEILDIPLIRFDMSEYQEKHTVARLIGAPPGYVGYEEGGLLTDAIRKTPYCVLLLDEIEKAHSDIFNVLLQVMDYATLTDNNGRKADFRNIILIMTSNAGAKLVGKELLGFGARKLEEDSITKEVERIFSPEFRNRLDEVVVFNKMDENMAYLIAKKAISEFGEKLSSKNIKLNVTEKCYKWIAKRGLSSIYGAREILRIVQQEVKPYFVDAVLFGELSGGGNTVVDVVDEKIIIEKSS